MEGSVPWGSRKRPVPRGIIVPKKEDPVPRGIIVHQKGTSGRSNCCFFEGVIATRRTGPTRTEIVFLERLP